MDSSSGGSKMRFLSFSNDKEDAEKEAKLKEAALKIEQAINKDKALDELVDYQEPDVVPSDPVDDTRPLFERLMEQRNKKKEEIEESHKLSNLVTKLDEDDVRHLNEVARTKYEEETKKRLEVYDALEEKKRLRQKIELEKEDEMKKSLLANKLRPKTSTSSLKSRLSNVIKVRPKSSVANEPLANKSVDKREAPENINIMSTSKDPENSDSNSGHAKRQKIGSECDVTPCDKLTTSKEKDNLIGDQICTCPLKDTMKCIGILPSMPTVKKNPDSSEDSDDSDDLNKRIVPRIGRSK